MSSLSDKVKNLLSGNKETSTSTSTSTQQGQQGQHPPGSFPTEEMEPSQTTQGYSKGYEQNKLHKPEDPRGFTEGDNNTPRGHAYKDSGVGLTESQDPTPYKPSQEPIPERRNDPLDRTTDSAAAGGLGETTNLAGKEGATGTTGTTEQSSQPPYWGDLPGGGVHNTVIGHGSPEDEAERHRAVHSGATEPTRTAGTLESGTFLHQRGDDHKTSTTGPHDTQTDPKRDTSDSHLKEGAAGAGAVGAGALGAHELSKKRHDDETPAKADQTKPEEHKSRSFPLLGHKDKEPKEEKHKEEKHKEPKEKGESKLGALLHRLGSKDKSETEAKAEQEADKERHHHSKAPLAAAGAGAAGAGAYAASRDHHDDKTQRDTTTAAHQNPATQHATQHPASGLDSTRDYSNQPTTGATGTTQQPHQQQDSHRGAGLATGAAAGLGAGALASHYGQRSEHDRTAQPSGYDAQRVDPTATSSPARDPTQTYQQPGSHGDHSLAKGAAAGVGAGALASQVGHHSGSTQPDSTQDYAQRDQPANFSHKDPVGQHHDSHRGEGLAAGTATGLSAGTLASHSGHEHQPERSGLESNRGFESQPSQPTQTSTSQAYQQQEPHSHRGAGLAAGTAAGLGAGALASRSGRDHHNEQSGLDSNRGLESQGTHPIQTSTRDPTYQQEGSHRGTGLAAGTAAGLGAGALASHSGRERQPEHSGLESNRGLESQGTYPTQTSARDPTSQSYQQQDTHSHQGTGLAAGTAAGVGAGALASHESNKRDDRYLSNDSSMGAQSKALGTAAPMGTSSSAFDSSKNEPFTSQSQSHQSGQGHSPTLTENANAGKYNTLASGTPSGVRVDDDLDTTRSSQPAHVDTPQKKDHHYGTAAGVGAGAATAAAAAAMSHKDEKPVEQSPLQKKDDLTKTEPQTERQLGRDTEHKPITGAVAPGLNKPVMHKCQKCGEDNDISQYFTSNAPGKI